MHLALLAHYSGSGGILTKGVCRTGDRKLYPTRVAPRTDPNALYIQRAVVEGERFAGSESELSPARRKDTYITVHNYAALSNDV